MDIVLFVSSLTPSEKQTFKKLYSGDNEFVRLFNYINTYKNFDTEKIKKFLAKKSGKKPEKYTSSYISVIKNYLKEKILESLRLQKINKRSSFEILIRAINAEVLMEKGLLDMASKELGQGKEAGGLGIFPIEKLVIVRRQSMLNYYKNYQDFSLESLQEFHKHRLELVRQIGIETVLANALNELGFHQFKQLDPLKYIEENDIINQVKRIENWPNLNFENQYLLYWIKSYIAEFQNKPKEAISFMAQAVKVWLDNPNYIEIHPRMYLGTCFAHLKLIHKFASHEKLILKQNHFQAIMEKVNILPLIQGVRNRYETIFLFYQLYTFKANKSFELIVEAIPQVEAILNRKDYTTNFLKITFLFYVSCGLFQVKKYEPALDWISPILNNKKLDFSANPDLFAKSILLYIFIHFHLGNYRFLQYELKKKEKMLKKINKWEKIHETSFGQLTKMVNTPFSTAQHQLNIDNFSCQFSELISTCLDVG